MKITKATTEQKAEYRKGTHVYPLYGYVTKRGITYVIEHPNEGKGEPNYEVMAPNGLHFCPDYTHTLLCTTLEDVRSRLAGNQLEPCGLDCY